MMKGIVYLLILCILTGCKKEPIFNENNDIKIAVATDIHYFAKEYYEECSWFEDEMLYGDGKMVTYADEIIDAFIDSVIKQKVDMVLLTGDLTFNGEIGSHQALAEKLKRLEDNGVQVAVTAGNHDIDNIYTKGYGKDDYIEVDNISGEDFKDIYKDFGYDISVCEHKESLSYEIHLNDKYSLIVIDSNTHEMTTGSALDTGGKITDSTKKWLMNRLEYSKKNNRVPLIAMHHNLGIHSELLNNGYTIADNETFIDLFHSYSVPIVLSGHLHMQSILDVDGIKEIATSSLVVNPLQYGLLEMSNDKIKYNTQSLMISKNSEDYFDEVGNNKFYNETDDEGALLKRKAIVLANKHYFAGTIASVKDEIMNMEGYTLIMKEDDNFYKLYLESMLKNDNNNTGLEIKIQN